MTPATNARILFKLGHVVVFEISSPSYVPQQLERKYYIWRDKRIQHPEGMFEGLYSCMENYAKYLKTYQDQNMKIVPIKPPETEKNNLIQVSFSQKRRIDPPPTV